MLLQPILLSYLGPVFSFSHRLILWVNWRELLYPTRETGFTPVFSFLCCVLMFRLSLSCVVCAVCCQCFLDCPFGFLSRLFQFFWLWVYTKLDIYGFITESYHALRHKRQIDVYYVFITEPYHVLWYKGQIDVYYVFITEPYHVLWYKGQIDV